MTCIGRARSSRVARRNGLSGIGRAVEWADRRRAIDSGHARFHVDDRCVSSCRSTVGSGRPAVRAGRSFGHRRGVGLRGDGRILVRRLRCRQWRDRSGAPRDRHHQNRDDFQASDNARRQRCTTMDVHPLPVPRYSLPSKRPRVAKRLNNTRCATGSMRLGIIFSTEALPLRLDLDVPKDPGYTAGLLLAKVAELADALA